MKDMLIDRFESDMTMKGKEIWEWLMSLEMGIRYREIIGVHKATAADRIAQAYGEPSYTVFTILFSGRPVKAAIHPNKVWSVSGNALTYTR